MIKVTRKIGSNRGKPRIWIEGKHLVDAGFQRGDTWTLVETSQGFMIRADRNGARKVSGKGERPVIDICGASLGVLATGWERAELLYNAGSGMIIVQGDIT